MAVPRLRLSEFNENESYEYYRIGDFFSERSDRASGTEELLSVTRSNGIVRQSEVEKKNTASEDKSNYKKVFVGDLAYNSMRMWQGAEGISPYNGIVSPAYTVMIPKKNANVEYFSYMFKRKSMLNLFQRFSQGLTSDTWNLKFHQISKLKIAVPSLPEQQKIADFLTTFDKRITAQENIISDLEDIKKGYMHKIFSQELRFKDDNGEEYPEWEEKKLGDCCDLFKSGKNINANQICEVGEYPVYGGNGLRGYTSIYSHDGEYVLIGRQGALCGNVCYVNGKSYMTEHAIVVHANSQNCIKFLQPLFEYMNLNQYSAQSAQPGLAVNKIVKLKQMIPSLSEQQKIASFLSTFDKKIEAEKKVLEDYKEIKKGLLQQMFV